MDHGDATDLVRTPTPRALASGVLASTGGDLDATVALLCGAIRVLRGHPEDPAPRPAQPDRNPGGPRG